MRDGTPAYIQLILDCFEAKQRKYPRYSFREFARTLGVPTSSLSEILKLKYPLSFRMADLLIPFLGLKKHEKQIFLSSLAKVHQERRYKNRKKKKLPDQIESVETLSNERYGSIADWYYAGILTLVEAEGYRHSAKWVAEKLGIHPYTAKTAMLRLEQMGLLALDPETLREAPKTLDYCLRSD